MFRVIFDEKLVIFTMTSIPDLLESSASQNHLPPSNIEKTNSTSKDTLDHDNLHSDTFHENQPDNLSNQSTDSPQENPPDSEFPTQPETLADFGNFDDFSSYSKQKIETTKDAFGDFPVGDEPAKPNSNNDDFGNFGDFPETSNQPSTQVVQLNGNDSFADFADFSSSKPTQNQSIQDDFSFGEFPSDSNHQKTANDNNFGDFGNFPESTASETPATSSNNKTSQNTTNSNTADQNSDPFFSSSTNQNRQSEDFFSEFPNSSNNQNNSNFPAEFPVSQKKNFPEKVSRRLVVGPIEDFMDLCGNILEDYWDRFGKIFGTVFGLRKYEAILNLSFLFNHNIQTQKNYTSQSKSTPPTTYLKFNF